MNGVVEVEFFGGPEDGRRVGLTEPLSKTVTVSRPAAEHDDPDLIEREPGVYVLSGHRDDGTPVYVWMQK